jgi:glutamate formiminotransferase
MWQAHDVSDIAGQGLGAGELAVPVLLYGAAHGEGRTLADIRRACGYFKGAQRGRFEGSGDVVLPGSLRPDYGPAQVDPSRGLATVGAVPWVVNYNVLLGSADMAAARAIARAVSGRGGGLRHVEAMALPHEAGEQSPCCPRPTTSMPPQLAALSAP